LLPFPRSGSDLPVLMFCVSLVAGPNLLHLLPFLSFKPHFSQLQGYCQVSMRNIRDSLFSWHSFQNFTGINAFMVFGTKHPQIPAKHISFCQTL
jgi:hypothetical protein